MKSLTECQTIEEVAEQINMRLDNGELFRAERMAEKYAFAAAVEAGYSTAPEMLEAHRECLRDAGARV
jgi:hypothetical protein